MIPVTVDDLTANGLLGVADPRVCWERSVETLTARKDDITGLAIASDDRIEAYLLYVKRGVEGTEIVSLRSFVEDGGARLNQLLSRLHARGMTSEADPTVERSPESSGEPLTRLAAKPWQVSAPVAANARTDWPRSSRAKMPRFNEMAQFCRRAGVGWLRGGPGHPPQDQAGGSSS